MTCSCSVSWPLSDQQRLALYFLLAAVLSGAAAGCFFAVPVWMDWWNGHPCPFSVDLKNGVVSGLCNCSQDNNNNNNNLCGILWMYVVDVVHDNTVLPTLWPLMVAYECSNNQGRFGGNLQNQIIRYPNNPLTNTCTGTNGGPRSSMADFGNDMTGYFTTQNNIGIGGLFFLASVCCVVFCILIAIGVVCLKRTQPLSCPTCDIECCRSKQ